MAIGIIGMLFWINGGGQRTGALVTGVGIHSFNDAGLSIAAEMDQDNLWAISVIDNASKAVVSPIVRAKPRDKWFATLGRDKSFWIFASDAGLHMFQYDASKKIYGNEVGFWESELISGMIYNRIAEIVEVIDLKNMPLRFYVRLKIKFFMIKPRFIVY